MVSPAVAFALRRQHKRHLRLTAEPLAAVVGEAFSYTPSFKGGVAPYAITLSGTLPDGLALEDGVIGGTPTEAGEFKLWAAVVAANTRTGDLPITLVVHEAP